MSHQVTISVDIIEESGERDTNEQVSSENALGNDACQLKLETDIIKAIQEGNIEKVKEWIHSVEDKSSDEASTCCVINSIVDVRQEIFQIKRCELNCEGMTALHFAVLYCKKNIVEILLKAGADPEVENVGGENALHCAIQSEGEDLAIAEVVSLLLHKGSSIPYTCICCTSLYDTGEDPPETHPYADKKSNPSKGVAWTPLLIAVYLNLPETVCVLLQHGADPSYKPGKRDSLSMAAIHDGRVLQILLESQKSLLTKLGSQALRSAVISLKPKCVELLVQYGANVKSRDGYGRCPIHYALRTTSSTDFERMVASLKQSVNEEIDREDDGRTVLHLAVAQNKVEHVRILVDKGEADCMKKDKSGNLPIHCACEHISQDFEDLVQMLKKSVNKMNGQGLTPLHIVAINNEKDHLCILCRNNANVKMKTTSRYHKQSLIHIATNSREGSDEDFERVIKYLTNDRKLNINEADENGTIPLHVALRNKNFSRVLILLDHEADPLIQDSEGKNALHIAFENNAGGNIIMKLLEGHSGIDEKRDRAYKLPIHYLSAGTPISSIRALERVSLTPEPKEMETKKETLSAIQRKTGPFSVGKDGGSSSMELKNVPPPGRGCSCVNKDHITGEVSFSVYCDGEDKLCVCIEKAHVANCSDVPSPYIKVSLVSSKGTICQKTDVMEKNHNPEYKTVKKFMVSKTEAATCDLLLEVWDQSEKFLGEIRHNISSQDLNHQTKMHQIQLKDRKSALNRAIELKRNDIVEVLLVKGAKVDRATFMAELKKEDKDLVKILVRHSKIDYLLSLMKEEFHDDQLVHRHYPTTPFRELIQHMPESAKEVLQRSFKLDKKNEYVTFNYSLLQPWHPTKPGILKFVQHFDKEKGLKNPLKLMVKYKRTELLQHPVIGSYLHLKWNRIGFWYYFFTLVLYGIFLVSLSLFSLLVNRPRDNICLSTNVTVSSSPKLDNCGSIHRLGFTFLFAVLTILLSVYHFILEMFQIVIYKWKYFRELRNYGELPLYILSIIYVSVFFNDCGCPMEWQWQVGIFAVFLGWINLIIYVSKLPKTGIYVLIFYRIVVTFVKLISFSILLVLAFSLILFMVFNDPMATTSVFSNIGHSFVKTVTMVSGELDFESLFRLGVDPDRYEPIPYHGSAFLIWIIFIILIPIILNNMLTSLAVGDTEQIRETAELTKLELQVHTFVQAEEFVPDCILKCLDPRPDFHRFRDHSSKYQVDEENYRIVKLEVGRFQSFWRWIQLFIWGGKDYMEQIKEDTYHERLDEEQKEINGDVRDDNQSVTQNHIITKLDDLFELAKSNEEKIRKMNKFIREMSSQK